MTIVVPRDQKARQAWVDNIKTIAYHDGFQKGREYEQQQRLPTRVVLIDQAVQLLQESSKMMSRAGYLVDKVNGSKT